MNQSCAFQNRQGWHHWWKSCWFGWLDLFSCKHTWIFMVMLIVILCRSVEHLGDACTGSYTCGIGFSFSFVQLYYYAVYLVDSFLGKSKCTIIELLMLCGTFCVHSTPSQMAWMHSHWILPVICLGQYNRLQQHAGGLQEHAAIVHSASLRHTQPCQLSVTIQHMINTMINTESLYNSSTRVVTCSECTFRNACTEMRVVGLIVWE